MKLCVNCKWDTFVWQTWLRFLDCWTHLFPNMKFTRNVKPVGTKKSFVCFWKANPKMTVKSQLLHWVFFWWSIYVKWFLPHANSPTMDHMNTVSILPIKKMGHCWGWFFIQIQSLTLFVHRRDVAWGVPGCCLRSWPFLLVGELSTFNQMFVALDTPFFGGLWRSTNYTSFSQLLCGF
jgi:hypothetical protein